MTRRWNRLDDANDMVQDLIYQLPMNRGKKQKKEIFEQLAKAKRERDAILEELKA